MEFQLQPGFAQRQCKTRLKPELHAEPHAALEAELTRLRSDFYTAGDACDGT